MQRKTIEKVIYAKMEQWLETIKDENLRKRVSKYLLVSGGSITSMFLGEDVNDYDVYLQDKGTLIDLVKYYIAGHDLIILEADKQIDFEDENIGGQYARALRNLKPNQVRIFTKNMAGGLKAIENPTEDDIKAYKPAFFSPNAISLLNNVQIVNRFHGTPEEIHKTFDFIHATNYFTMDKGLVTNLAAVESILTKQLKYQGSLYPVTSVIRTKKFLNRKWNINAGEQLKMMFQISQLDLTNVDVLEEQLIGVDVAYFGALIVALRSTKVNIDNVYLAAIIDKIFSE